MRLRALYGCVSVVTVLVGIVSQGTACRAQADARPLIPASLLVPDRFARAVRHQSTAPYYLIVTVVNDSTSEQQIVCTDGTRLFDAVKIENKLGRSREDWDKAMRLILDNSAHTYHFSNTDAWKLVQTWCSSQMLTAVREEFRSFSLEALADRFSYEKTGGIVKTENAAFTADIHGYVNAVAYVLTERGLLVGRGDFAPGIYVITPRILAEEEKLRKKYDEQTRRKKAAGQKFATNLPGYASLVRNFKVSDADVGEYWSGFCFSTSVYPLSPQLVDVIEWVVPVKEKTKRAKYDWNQFLPMTSHVERLARQHPWLESWKAAGQNRTIHAQMYGKNLFYEMDDEIETDIRPAWKDAGLQGKPYCQLRLRWQEDGEGAGATLYLPLPGSGENRSLIVSSHPPYHTDTTVPGLHWLDKLSIYSWAIADPRQAVVVSPDGRWKVLTLPTRPRPYRGR